MYLYFFFFDVWIKWVEIETIVVSKRVDNPNWKKTKKYSLIFINFSDILNSTYTFFRNGKCYTSCMSGNIGNTTNDITIFSWGLFVVASQTISVKVYRT